MKQRLTAILAVGVALAIALFSSPSLFPVSAMAAEASPPFEAVSAEVPVGKAVRIEVRVKGSDGRAIAGPVAVTATRLDMGPDGMETMTSGIQAVSSTQAGVLAFEADFTMAGRWALTLTATVEGYSEPVTGVVIFNATEKKAEATPAAPAAGDRKIAYYRHPMGLPDTSPVPKKDEMGMDYIPVYEDEISGPAGSVRLSPDKIQRSGIRTQQVTRQPLEGTILGTGLVEADERRMAVLSAKFEGFIEELYVNATGMVVERGQPLAKVWIASPEILQKQADYLTALKRGDAARAADNLRLFGIGDDVIDQLKKSGSPVRSIVLRAAGRGTVLERQALPGMRFAAGDTLLMLADLSSVWVMTQIAEQEMEGLQQGQTATITPIAGAGEALRGTVAFVYPALDRDTRTVRVRIEVPNPSGRLKLGQFADVAIDASNTSASLLTVPDSAVMDSGSRQVAFVAKEGGLFEPRDLVLGRRGGGRVEILSGLTEGERIVVAGNFLIDSESNLRSSLAGMSQPVATP